MVRPLDLRISLIEFFSELRRLTPHTARARCSGSRRALHFTVPLVCARYAGTCHAMCPRPRARTLASVDGLRRPSYLTVRPHRHLPRHPRRHRRHRPHHHLHRHCARARARRRRSPAPPALFCESCGSGDPGPSAAACRAPRTPTPAVLIRWPSPLATKLIPRWPPTCQRHAAVSYPHRAATRRSCVAVPRLDSADHLPRHPLPHTSLRRRHPDARHARPRALPAAPAD